MTYESEEYRNLKHRSQIAQIILDHVDQARLYRLMRSDAGAILFARDAAGAQLEISIMPGAVKSLCSHMAKHHEEIAAALEFSDIKIGLDIAEAAKV